MLSVHFKSSRAVRIVASMWHQIEIHDLFTHVAALTYTTVLSVVPLLALILAVGRGFGLDQYMEVQLREHINAPEEVVTRLMDFANSYISRVHNETVIGVSLLVLAFTVISLVNNIERRFNIMWDIPTSRSLFRFSFSYLGLCVFLVFAIFLMMGMGVFFLNLLNHLPRFSWIDQTIPVLIWIGKGLSFSLVLGLMYKYIPLPRVHWVAVWFPALISGFLFGLVQQFYIESQLFLSSYNAIYGSFAVLPLLMVWIYATWTICLCGVLLCYVIQHANEEEELLLSQRPSRSSTDVLALQLLLIAGRRFMKGESPLTASAMAQSIGIPTSLVIQELERLCEVDLLYAPQTESEKSDPAHKATVCYRVNTDLHTLTIDGFLNTLDSHGAMLQSKSSKDWEALTEIRKQWGHCATGHLPLAALF